MNKPLGYKRKHIILGIRGSWLLKEIQQLGLVDFTNQNERENKNVKP